MPSTLPCPRLYGLRCTVCALTHCQHKEPA